MTSQDNFDPLDRELIERAFESAWTAIKGSEAISDYETDEKLVAALRCGLIGIARENGLQDAEALRDLVLATISCGPERRHS
jgi:hypothetical protein